MKYYKFLNEENRSTYQSALWNLPIKNDDGSYTPGEWMPEIEGDLVMCENGYHLTDANHLLDWREAQLFESEVDGETLEGDTKIAARRVRLWRRVEGWNERNLRLFAVWCARNALALIENPDSRSIAACDVAEKYANGAATTDELSAAMAAWAAARDAAWAAARDAARDAQYKKLYEMIGIEP